MQAPILPSGKAATAALTSQRGGGGARGRRRESELSHSPPLPFSRMIGNLIVPDHSAMTAVSSPKPGLSTPTCSVLISRIGAMEFGTTPSYDVLTMCRFPETLAKAQLYRIQWKEKLVRKRSRLAWTAAPKREFQGSQQTVTDCF